jgi:hypothetical protein
VSVRAPDPPRGLASGGRALWKSMTTLHGRALRLRLRPDELAVLRVACETRDLLDELLHQHRQTGLIVEGSKRQPKLSGLPAEIRQQRTALARLLAAVDMPDEDNKSMTYSSRRASLAAHVRWRNEDERRQSLGLAPRAGQERRLDAAEADG